MHHVFTDLFQNCLGFQQNNSFKISSSFGWKSYLFNKSISISKVNGFKTSSRVFFSKENNYNSLLNLI
jgi:hypothetical protein